MKACQAKTTVFCTPEDCRWEEEIEYPAKKEETPDGWKCAKRRQGFLHSGRLSLGGGDRKSSLEGGDARRMKVCQAKTAVFALQKIVVGGEEHVKLKANTPPTIDLNRFKIRIFNDTNHLPLHMLQHYDQTGAGATP